MRSNPAKGMSAVAVAVVLTACSGPTLPSTSADCSAFTPSSPDIVCVTGTVRYFGLLGLLVGPLALSYFFELIRMYREEYLEPEVAGSR